jgi:hypothetical protein
MTKLIRVSICSCLNFFRTISDIRDLCCLKESRVQLVSNTIMVQEGLSSDVDPLQRVTLDSFRERKFNIRV